MSLKMTLEAHLQKIFSKLHRLGELLENSGHQKVYVSIEGALQYTEAQNIEFKFSKNVTAGAQDEYKGGVGNCAWRLHSQPGLMRHDL